MAITNATVVPIIYAATLVQKYRDARVYAQRTNRTWQDLLKNGGDTIRLSQPAAGVVGDYDVTGPTYDGITYTPADAAALADLTIDKHKYWAVKLDQIQQVQAVPNLIASQVAESAEELAQTIDGDVAAKMVASAGSGPAIALNHNQSDAFQASDFAFPAMQRLMTVAKMPHAGRWLIIGPYGMELLHRYALQNPVIAAGYVERSGLLNGLVGNFAGLDVYVSPQAITTAYNSGDNTVTETWVYGNNTATAFVEQVDRVDSLVLESRFEDAVRGLVSYGAHVIHADRISKSVVSITNVPA